MDPACVSVCPTKCMYFGDLDDPNSEISMLIKSSDTEEMNPEYALIPNVLYRNNGDGTFTDVTKSAGVDNGAQVGAGTCFLDKDGDGFTNLEEYIAGTAANDPGDRPQTAGAKSIINRILLGDP